MLLNRVYKRSSFRGPELSHLHLVQAMVWIADKLEFSAQQIYSQLAARMLPRRAVVCVSSEFQQR